MGPVFMRPVVQTWVTRKRVFILLRAWMVVLLSTLNIGFIARNQVLCAMSIAGLISMFWTLNVRDLAISCWKDRGFYMLGGVLGTGTSLWILHVTGPQGA